MEGIMGDQNTSVYKRDRERWSCVLQMIFYVVSMSMTSTTGQLTPGTPRADFQLTGGSKSNEGRLEARFPNTTEWVGVCKSSFFPIYASVICQDLGWWSACETLTTSEASAPQQSSSVFTLQARCLGWERSLSECDEVNFVDSSASCKPGEDVWLVCLAEPGDLEVRISDGNFEGEGYVELRCPGQKWSTICSQNWDMRDADIVCQHLGYPWSYSTNPEGEPGVTLGDIGYSNFLCTGINEVLIGQCAFTQENECSGPSGAAGVQCGVELNQQMVNVPASLCSGHHCGHTGSADPDYDPRMECRCDCHCTRFNDCCFDFLNQNATCDVLDSPIWGGVDPSLYECSPGPLSSIYKTAYVLITKCPDSFPNTTSTDRALCEIDRTFNDVIGLLPVYDSNGRVFKNVFCAVCHGLTVHDVTQWGIRLNYDPSNTGNGGYINPSLIIGVPGEIVGFQIIPPDNIFETRRCPYNLIETCPSDASDVDINKLCASYYAPVTFNDTLYRNPHCAICNGVMISDAQYCDSCADECPTDPFLPCADAPCQNTINIERADVQFSLDAFFKGVYGETEQVSCSKGELFDPFLRQCTAIPCTPSFNRSQEMCRDYLHGHNTSSPSPNDGDEVVTVPSTTTGENIGTRIHPILSCLLQVIDFGAQIDGIKETISSSVDDSQILDFYRNNCLETAPVSLSIVFEDRIDAFKLMKAFDAKFADNNDECPLCNISNINIYVKKLKTKISDALKEQCSMFYESDILSGMMNASVVALSKYNLTGKVEPSRTPEFCLQEKELTCVTTTFDQTAYEIVDANRSVWLADYNTTLNREDYVFNTDGTIEVCSLLLLTPWSQRPLFEIAIVACIGLSVVSLLVIFVVYIADSALRDIAGKCLLNMFVAFIFGLTLSVVCELFLFNQIACTTVAAVGHFAWLGAFCWMTLFASVIAIGIDGRGRVFCKIFGFGWIVPAVAVGLCLWIHFCQCMNVQLTYGGGVMCWLQGSEAVLFALVVPVTVLLLVCIIAFICGAIRVRKVREFVTVFSEEITESTVSDVILYIVLCLLLLIPWILAITYLLFEINILYDIHRIAFALQGVFVVTALLCTDKVRSLCKQKPSPVIEDVVAPAAGVSRQLSKRLDAPDGGSNRVWLKRDNGNEDIPGSIKGDNTWL